MRIYKTFPFTEEMNKKLEEIKKDRGWTYVHTIEEIINFYYAEHNFKEVK